jgi:recombination protein RecA
MSKAADIIKDLRKKKIDVSSLSDEDSPCKVSSWLSTGCITLDSIMGGGLPLGRIVEIYGDPSSGKSLIAAQAAAIAQEDGVIVAYADTETAVSIEMMEMLGVNVDELIYASPDTVEDVFTFFEETMNSRLENAPDSKLLLIWDSIAATSSDTEMENEYGKATMGIHARLISQGLRKMARIISKDKVAVLLMNQTRQKLGVMFGDDKATFGGKAVSFHSSIRVQLDISKKIVIPKANKKGKKVIGMNTRAVCVKNKLHIPFQDVVLPIYFGHGVDDALSAFYYLEDHDLITSHGPSKHMDLEGKTLKFQKTSWSDIFDKNYDQIADIIMNIGNEEITEE